MVRRASRRDLCPPTFAAHARSHTYVRAVVPRYSPFFVTWETSRESILRGCIGTLSPRRLRGGLAEYALLAGTRDSRFPPVTGVAELGDWR